MPTIANNNQNKGGRPLKYTTNEELEEAINKYFKECDDNNDPYTITGLAYSIGLDRKALITYGAKEQFSNTIKKAKDKVEVYAEKRLLSGNGNVTGVIFSLKNNWGWVDKQEIDASVNNEVTIEVKR